MAVREAGLLPVRLMVMHVLDWFPAGVSPYVLLGLFAAGYGGWTVSTLSGGGGALLLTPAVLYLTRPGIVAPAVTLTSLLGNPTRILLFREQVRRDIVAWYLPGALVGSVAGGWLFARTKAEWLQIVVALFLLSTLWQYRFGERERSFPMRLSWFLPLGVLISFLSALVGATGPLLNPFYLNCGVQKEPMVATRSVNSLAMQLAKVGTYAVFGAMSREALLCGLAAGLGAVLSNWTAKRWLARLSGLRFRQLVIAVMVLSGLSMLWDQRGVLLQLWDCLLR